MSDADALFGALADPTRRQVFDLLVSGGPSSATALSAEFPISRQAVSKHLGILEGAGLVTRQVVGRETRFVADPDRLVDLTSWIETVGELWEQRLGRLKDSFR